MNKKITIFLVLSFIANVFASAQNADSLQVSLNSLDVNAALTGLKAGSGKVLTVINRTEIEKLSVASIDDLLETISGIDIRNRGVGGTQADISIRGGSFDQVLVLLNGVNITDPQTGHYNLDIPLELSDVLRVEVLQGSYARMYGPNAFSGAINVVTANPQKSTLKAELSAGSFGTFLQNVSGSIGGKTLSTSLSVSNKSSQGYLPNTDYKIQNVFSQTTFNSSALGQFNLQLSYQQKSYGANAFYTFKYPSQFDHTQTLFGSLGWKKSINQFNFSANAYYRNHYDRFELYRDSIKVKPAWYTSHNYHLTDIAGANFLVDFSSEIGLFTLGTDVRNEHIYSTVLGVALTAPKENIFEKAHPFKYEDNRLITNVYLNYSKSFGALFLSAGAAVTNNEKFGTYTNGGAELSYSVNDNFRLFASANSAVRVPTFTDLYYKSATQKANPNLKPEKSLTFETGTKFNYDNIVANASVYYRKGTNVIDWVLLPDSTKWESKNMTSVNALGCDFQVAYEFENSVINRLTIAYSFVKLDKESANYDSKYALDYLKNKLVFGLNCNVVKNITANWLLSYNERAGDYTDFASSEKMKYSPFFMANLRLNWNLNRFNIYADANNILNEKYVDFGGLTQPGFNFNVGVRYKLD